MTYTLVSFHAHPDDEALLTAGTLARAAAEGHRVVLVVATAGEAGLASADVHAAGQLGQTRLAELRVSAQALGCARVECLGYADSGMSGGQSGGFAAVPLEQAAGRLAALLEEEAADVLTVYDARGGYGHPDHVQVHHVGVRAAELAGTPVVLEATVDRTALTRAARLVSWLPRLPAGFDLGALQRGYSSREEITHRVDVRPYMGKKRAAMAAHLSQSTADEGSRTLGLLLRLPMPLFRLALGHEWFVERGATGSGPPADDIFASLRSPSTPAA